MLVSVCVDGSATVFLKSPTYAHQHPHIRYLYQKIYAKHDPHAIATFCCQLPSDDLDARINHLLIHHKLAIGIKECTRFLLNHDPTNDTNEKVFLVVARNCEPSDALFYLLDLANYFNVGIAYALTRKSLASALGIHRSGVGACLMRHPPETLTSLSQQLTNDFITQWFLPTIPAPPTHPLIVASLLNFRLPRLFHHFLSHSSTLDVPDRDLTNRTVSMILLDSRNFSSLVSLLPRIPSLFINTRASCSKSLSLLHRLSILPSSSPSFFSTSKSPFRSLYSDLTDLILTYSLPILSTILNIRDASGNTPLHLSCSHWTIDAIHVLVRFNANVRSRNGRGMTPFQVFVGSDGRKWERHQRQQRGGNAGRKRKGKDNDGEGTHDWTSQVRDDIQVVLEKLRYWNVDDGGDDEGWEVDRFEGGASILHLVYRTSPSQGRECIIEWLENDLIQRKGTKAWDEIRNEKDVLGKTPLEYAHVQ